MFNFKKERIKWDQILGKGSFGMVFPYQKHKEDLDWVVKIIYAENDTELINSIEEIAIGFSCNHENIVPIKGFYIEKAQEAEKSEEDGPKYQYVIYLKLPRMKKTLKEKIQRDSMKGDPYSEEQVVQYFYSLASSIEYLHKKRIAHRDIRPVNIMLDRHDNIKLCDVGIARLVHEEDGSCTESKILGSLAYKAPEVSRENNLKKKGLFKADAWGLGLTIAELCLQKQGIYNFREQSMKARETELKEQLKKLKGKYSESLFSLLEGLLDFNPEKRISVENAKKTLERLYPHILLEQEIRQLDPKDFLNEQLKTSLSTVDSLSWNFDKYKVQNREFAEKTAWIHKYFDRIEELKKRLIDLEKGSLDLFATYRFPLEQNGDMEEKEPVIVLNPDVLQEEEKFNGNLQINRPQQNIDERFEEIQRVREKYDELNRIIQSINDEDKDKDKDKDKEKKNWIQRLFK